MSDTENWHEKSCGLISGSKDETHTYRLLKSTSAAVCFFFFFLHWSQLVNIQLEWASKLSFDISNWSYLLAIPKIWCHLSSSYSSSSSLPSNYHEVQKVFYSAHLSSSAPAHAHAQFFLCHPLTSMIRAKDIIYSLARRPLLVCNHRVPVHRQHTVDSYIRSIH